MKGAPIEDIGDVEDLLRRLAPQVLAALVRHYGHFETAEDAVQEALLAAATQWPETGMPERPDGWLIRVASRRLTDLLRSEQAGRRREERLAVLREPDALAPSRDDTLTLVMLCCHPSLTPATQVALTLRAVGGLTTAEIARAFLVPEPTMAQRISRAKLRIKATGATFDMPPEAERPERLRSVLHVLYLIFNEGYTATSGPDLHRPDLTAEAIRLTRQLPAGGETSGLLALMLLTDARRPARTALDGSLIPLAEQDRTKWNQESIQEGLALIAHALTHHRAGPYQLQAAIAAVHAEAKTAADTDWPQVLALYELLTDMDPNPIITLNKAVALAMVEGPQAGLVLVDSLGSELDGHHRLHAVRAHLLEMAGDHGAARDAYRTAARLTTSIPEQRYLHSRAEAL